MIKGLAAENSLSLAFKNYHHRTQTPANQSTSKCLASNMSGKSISSTLFSQYNERLEQIIKKRKQKENELHNGPSEFVKSLVENLKFESPEEIKERVYSNDMTDACKTVCKVCNNKVTLYYMRSHAKNMHGITIKEYRSMYGYHREHIVKEVYHKCGLCQKDLLLDQDDIHMHVRKHKFSLREYNAKFIMKSKTKSNRTIKKQPEALSKDDETDTTKEIDSLFDSL